MNELSIDYGTLSLHKYQEQLCGDFVEINSHQSNSVVMVLSDGLGSGVKANILATLSSKMIATMIAQGLSLKDAVESVAETLPICKVRGIAYSTFTVIHIVNQKRIEIMNFDNPLPIFIRNGKEYPLKYKTTKIDNREIQVTKIDMQENDVLFALSDGCVHAGVGAELNYGWLREHIVSFIESMYLSDYSAKAFASLIVNECNMLYQQKPGDDTTVLAIKIKKRHVVNLFVGPPEHKEKDRTALDLFFSKRGIKIVCGGTTSQLVSKYLNEPLQVNVDYANPSIPPSASIKGIDLVTEGIITLTRVSEYADEYLKDSQAFKTWTTQKDSVSKLCQHLFEDATNINFFVGKAINPAHQNPNLPIDFSLKMHVIDTLSQKLKDMGKYIKTIYF